MTRSRPRAGPNLGGLDMMDSCGLGELTRGQRVGLDISPHTLRHTFGTRLVRRKGEDLVAVAATMGHESLDTTAIYTQHSEEDMAEAVENVVIGLRFGLGPLSQCRFRNGGLEWATHNTYTVAAASASMS